jgi:hypothetical protein
MEAMSLVPEEVRSFFDLVSHQYLPPTAMRDFSREYRRSAIRRSSSWCWKAASRVSGSARDLCQRQKVGMFPVTREWRKLSPSAEVLVDPESGARCAIRDTEAAGADRYHWTVAFLGDINPVAAGPTGEPVEAPSLAGAALSAYVADRRELSDGDDGGGNSAVPKNWPQYPQYGAGGGGVK